MSGHEQTSTQTRYLLRIVGDHEPGREFFSLEAAEKAGNESGQYFVIYIKLRNQSYDESDPEDVEWFVFDDGYPKHLPEKNK